MENQAESQRDAQASRQFLAGRGVFTVEEFARHIGGARSIARARARLGYYVAQGRVRLVVGGCTWRIPQEGMPMGSTQTRLSWLRPSGLTASSVTIPHST